MTKQEAAIKYITENYLDYRRLRHDVIADKLQVRCAHPIGDRLEAKGERQEQWREMTKHDINSIVCHAAQEYDANITSREVMTALQSDLIPDVHPLREYVLSCGEWTEEQPDWIDWVASQVRVKNNDNIDNLRGNQLPAAPKENIGCRTAADVENKLTQLLLKAQNEHEEIILEVTDFRAGTEYGYNTLCPPELQKP